MSPGDPRRAFPTSIVESHADEPFLPHHMDAGGKLTLSAAFCNVSYTICRCSCLVRYRIRPLKCRRIEIQRKEQTLLELRKALSADRLRRQGPNWPSRCTI